MRDWRAKPQTWLAAQANHGGGLLCPCYLGSCRACAYRFSLFLDSLHFARFPVNLFLESLPSQLAWKNRGKMCMRAKKNCLIVKLVRNVRMLRGEVAKMLLAGKKRHNFNPFTHTRICKGKKHLQDKQFSNTQKCTERMFYRLGGCIYLALRTL